MLNFHEFSILEYSKKIKDLLNVKFKKENPTLTDQQINYYIDKFEQKKSSPLIKEKDITRYSFSELEKLIDSNFSSASPKIKEDFSNEAIYVDGSLSIYNGDTKEKCIKYGSGEIWCTSRTDTSNMYNTYRYRMNEVTLYFVFDSERNDDFSKIVVLVDSSGRYYMANRSNDGDFSGGKKFTWADITEKQPKLETLEYLFKPIPLSEKEREDYNKVKNKTRDDLVKTFKTFDMIELYISMQHELSDEQFINIHNDLQSKYINIGHQLTDIQFESCSGDLRMRYISLNQPIDSKLRYMNSNEVKKAIEFNIKRNNGSVIFRSIFEIPPKGFEFPDEINGDFILSAHYLSTVTLNDIKLPKKVNGDFKMHGLDSKISDKSITVYPKIVNGHFVAHFRSGDILPEYVKNDCRISLFFLNGKQSPMKLKLPSIIGGNLTIESRNVPEQILYPKELGGRVYFNSMIPNNIPKYYKGRIVPLLSKNTESELKKLGFVKKGNKYVLETRNSLYHITDIDETFQNELDYYNVENKIPSSVRLLLMNKKNNKKYRILLEDVSNYIDSETIW